jgi:hypothetical protein
MAKVFSDGEDAFYGRQDLITKKVAQNLAKFGVDADTTLIAPISTATRHF